MIASSLSFWGSVKSFSFFNRLYLLRFKTSSFASFSPFCFLFFCASAVAFLFFDSENYNDIF
ncbi:hypothetical protein O53_5262 [Microcystis aeruginosa TAIHU98]|uniref:Uncharacterized protein n=1 Tax=Microcystis aeruginosa TAIHU98 TaxID=1134457 RepID=L7E228_MICAE|nr:hypothetical protein O53_5262 [Microcystis aeruginosa TAIHU98]